jgi:hypothetical protein
MKSSVDSLSRFAAVVLCAIPTLALPHHGIGAQFDLSQTVELQGEIKELLWRNPHVRFTLGVVDASGDEALWVVEAQSITGLRQRDITQVLFDVGDQITLAGNPAHGGKTEIYAANALLPDGREVLFAQTVEPRWSDLAMGATGPRFATTGDASAPELGLFRVWSAHTPRIWRNFGVDTVPLSREARAEGEAFDRLTGMPGMGECAPPGMPNIIGNPYPREFVEHGDTILMRLEHYDTVRTIHMTPLAQNSEPPASPLGYSVGHWDDDTLVVTTTKILNGDFRLGITLSEDLQVVERYSPSTDGSRLDIQLTLTDPDVFLEPVELDAYWIYVADVSVEPYECVES